MKAPNKLICKRLGKEIQNLRKQKNFSKKSLAKMCKIESSYLKLIESGEVDVKIKDIKRLTKSLNVKPSKLFRDADL